MIATRAQERCVADSSNPLLDLGTLKNVLSYLDPGHHLFVSVVCRWWRDLYATLPTQQLASYPINKHQKVLLPCEPPLTLYSSVFTSPARVQFAHKSGLDCTSERYGGAAGMYADVATLAAAHTLGMPYTEATIISAAQCNKFAELRYLHSQGCPWSPHALTAAASSGSLELLRWCYERGCPCDGGRVALCGAES
eukprot:16270-Heterococcus_DN1.PRE.8